MYKLTQSIARLIASTFYSGLSPIAPGTVGAAITIAILWFLPPISSWILGGAAVVMFLVGVWAAKLAEQSWGHDAGKINWDETVGMLLTILFLPKTMLIYGVAFVVCRVLDVIKPYPANVSQKLPHGWGVMIDDVIAGIYGNLLLQIVFRVLFAYD